MALHCILVAHFQSVHFAHVVVRRVAWTKSSEDIAKRVGVSGAEKSKSSVPFAG